MTTNKTISKMLKLKDLKLTDITFKARKNELYLSVKPYKNGCLCPHCHRRGKIKNILKEARAWRDIRVCGWTIFFLYCPKEIICPTHGRVQEEIPWADQKARITYRLEFLVLTYSQLMTQQAAAKILDMANSTFSDILHRTISRIRDGHRIRGLKAIGVDEVSYCKGHKYITVVYDLERSRVLWVGKGKGSDTIDRFFNTALSDYQKKKVVWGCCDMSETYINAIKKHCPNAQLVLDRFHIVKALNSAVDEVRKEQWRKASKKQRKALKGLRWILFRHSTKRSPEDQALLGKLKRGNHRIYRASVLNDEFNLFWNFADKDAARDFLKKWGTTALKSRLEPIRKFVRTLRKHIDDIISFVDSRLTNAVAEGMNRIIGIIRNRASGFRSVDAFIDLIYLVLGDVDVPDKIPNKFRTL
jgi:transposase